MEQPNNIDQFFRERLQGAEVPPPAFVWPNVERELRGRRRRFFFWLWFGLGLAGAGLWALWPSAVHREALTVSRPPSGADPASASALRQQASTGAGEMAGREEDYERTAPDASATSQKSPAGGRPKPAAERRPVSAVRPAKGGPVRPADPVELPAVTLLPVEKIPEAIADGIQAPPAAQVPGAPVVSDKKPSGALVPEAEPTILHRKNPKNCYNFAQHPKVWLIDVYAGPSLPKREFSASHDSFTNYLNLRRQTERPDWAFNAGVRGSLLFGRHFLLRTGLHYEQHTEVFEYADPDYVEVNIRQTIKIVDNHQVIVIDTIGVEYGDHYVKTYNRYGQLDVPLLAGLEFRHGRLGLSLQAGGSVNVFFWKRGTLLNAQGDPQRFTPGKKDALPVYRPRAGWSTTASAQLFYHLRARTRIFAEPYYSHTLRPLTLDGQPIALRYTTWGLKLGLTKIID